MNLEELGEFGFIRRINTKLGISSELVVKGIGDDTAVFKTSAYKLALLTTDSLVESVHFKLDYMPMESLGWKALAVNISDIAAMGGTPKFAVISLAIPLKFHVVELDAFYSGLKEAAKRFHINIIGGDTTRSPDKFVVSVTLYGEGEAGKLLYRSGANVGDKIWVTGKLGGSYAGLKCLLEEVDAPKTVITRHLRPIPKIRESKLIADSRIATSAIDISDGLVSDLGHICQESNVGALLIEDNIPIDAGVKEIADHFEEDPVDWALNGGEDYELIITIPPDKSESIEKTLPDLFCIGEIIEKDKAMIIEDKKGKITSLDLSGYDHFKLDM